MKQKKVKRKEDLEGTVLFGCLNSPTVQILPKVEAVKSPVFASKYLGKMFLNV